MALVVRFAGDRVGDCDHGIGHHKRERVYRMRTARQLKAQVDAHFENMTRSRIETERDLERWTQEGTDEQKAYWQTLWNAIQTDPRYGSFVDHYTGTPVARRLW